MKIPALNITKRPPAAPTEQIPPAEKYRHQPGHLADAGGAYAVLPWGLVDQLPTEQQQQLVDVLIALRAAQPQWAARTTYQVLPWRRVRTSDLDDRELSWHGITSDVDPDTNTVTYARDGALLAAVAVIGHRPGIDPAPHPAGTNPGLRPPLLPAPPEAPSPAPSDARSQQARLGRAHRLVTTRDRLAQLTARHPGIATSWAESIAATDDAWTPDAGWKALADLDKPGTVSPTPPAADPAPPIDADPADRLDVAQEKTPVADEPKKPWTPEPPQDYGIAALDAELRDLVGEPIPDPTDTRKKDLT